MKNTVAPAALTVRPGHQLVPAALGRPGQQTIVHVECPTNWCTRDHAGDDAVTYPEDIDHGGADTDWEAHCLTRETLPVQLPLLTLHARLHSDPVAADPRLRDTHIELDDESAFVFLTPDQADQTANGLIALGMEMKRLAEQARRENGQAAVVRNQADEALRRVREARV